MAYKKLGDSSIGYNEGINFLRAYLKKNPAAIFSPDSILAGKIVLDANQVLGLNSIKGKYFYQFMWAKDLVPMDHIHSQYLIYNVTQKEADSLKSIYDTIIKKYIPNYADYYNGIF